ncbi:MAG: hypothetical protein K6T16_02880, partial [Candidatus Pacearchaeota archaeon]|nr:hypothetical protein [Candidatus Pacearchaeota archaeon]
VLHPGNGTVGSGCHGSGDTKGNWTNTSSYNPECMKVRNDGNQKVEVNVSSGKNAGAFIGGTSPNYTMFSEQLEANSCGSGLIGWPGIEMNTSNRTACSVMWHNESNDEIYVGCYLKIPSDAPVEAKTDTWNFYDRGGSRLGRIIIKQEEYKRG